MKLKSIFAVAVSAAGFLLLQGCETVDYMAQSEQQLCMSYLTLPSYNIWQSDREQAIRARGINCSQYAGAAQARVQADQAFENTLRALNNQSGSTQYAPSGGQSGTYQNAPTCFFKSEYTSGLNKVCFYDCVGSTKSMNVSAASLCPIQASI